jgi:chitin-binding protein
MIAAVAMTFSLTLFAAQPAFAHGAMSQPVSRVLACGPTSPENEQSPACKAAITLSGPQAFVDWDNVRLANVGGHDRQRIPDGMLCSAGITEYKGLDLARADWPATTLSVGSDVTFMYRETIPHRGTFRIYITKDGYDPTRPLRWSDLEPTPFLTAIDPALNNHSYLIKGKLPANKTGRHLIYTIWQTSSTPDTYYSCSDVIVSAPTTAPAVAATQPMASPTIAESTTTVSAWAATSTNRKLLLAVVILTAPLVAAGIATFAVIHRQASRRKRPTARRPRTVR